MSIPRKAGPGILDPGTWNGEEPQCLFRGGGDNELGESQLLSTIKVTDNSRILNSDRFVSKESVQLTTSDGTLVS